MFAGGCASTPPRPRVEDVTRSDAPVPACVLPLPARRTAAGARNLKELQYWKLLFPAFDEANRSLARGGAACTGLRVDEQPGLAGAASRRGAPLKVEEGDALFAAGGDRMRVVWLRMFNLSNGREGGALALVRTREDAAEVYAVGVLKADPKKVRLGLERLDGRILVTAADPGCEGQTGTTPCESSLHLFLPVEGRLVEATSVPTERVAFATSQEPGTAGRVVVRLESTPRFANGQVQVFEQLKVSDEQGHVLRVAELQRAYRLDDDGTVAESDPSLWSRFFKDSSAAK
jgi:hypothetical protein